LLKKHQIIVLVSWVNWWYLEQLGSTVDWGPDCFPKSWWFGCRSKIKTVSQSRFFSNSLEEISPDLAGYMALLL